MKPDEQNPTIKVWVEKCEKDGATVYRGNSFLVATWPNGRRLEMRVDPDDLKDTKADETPT